MLAVAFSFFRLVFLFRHLPGDACSEAHMRNELGVSPFISCSLRVVFFCYVLGFGNVCSIAYLLYIPHKTTNDTAHKQRDTENIACSLCYPPAHDSSTLY